MTDLDRLRAALRSYGCHRATCSVGPSTPCNCGLHEALSSQAQQGETVVVPLRLAKLGVYLQHSNCCVLETHPDRILAKCNCGIDELRALLGSKP